MHGFLSKFLSKEEAEEPYSAAEAARFRLIACTISQPGNVKLVLGTHDANLIYRHLRYNHLSKAEKRALISTSLESLESSTIPLWHWLFEKDSEIRSELVVRTVSGTEKQKRSAFSLLEKLSIAPKDYTDPIGKEYYPNWWFAKDLSDNLIVSALEYLGTVGDEEIEVDWNKLISSSEANIAAAAIRSFVRKTARYNVTDALHFISKHEGADIGKKLTEKLLTNVNTIETEVLRNCLNNRTTGLVKAIATELYIRASLTKSDGQLLCESSDAETRLIGVRALRQVGSTISISDARKLLVKPRNGNALGLFSQPQNRDYPGESALEKFEIEMFNELSYKDLLELQEDSSFYSTVSTLAIYAGHFNKVKSQIEKNLLDGFNGFFTDKRKPLLGTSSEPSVSVFNFVRVNTLQSAFEIFCSKAVKSDLVKIRTVVDKNEVKFAPETAKYLGRYGEWQDVARLTKLSGNMKYGFGFSLLNVSDHSSNYRIAAKSILKLGLKRIADLWKQELPTPVRVQLVIQMTKKLFSAFDDKSIIDMLLMESDDVREAVALKAALCLTKSRLRKILDAYYNVDGNYYYNAIFWLDLGVSADRATSRAVALKKIADK